ncbi:hypothetical protein [Desertibaculum subflavum]|uniref:hypothetical protein n=1 Tax=Desertibaculum subflavum TaxID=2268458 RepID=UPI0013C5397C
MVPNIELLKNQLSDICLVVCAGFEDRAPRAAELIEGMDVRARSVLLLTYPGEEHSASYERLMSACHRIAHGPGAVRQMPLADALREPGLVEVINMPGDLVVCDITALSRIALFSILTRIVNSNRRLWLLYTEAEEYWPTKEDYGRIKLDRASDMSEAFFNLTTFEHAEIVYSGRCRVEEIPGFEGRHLPNYPLMLIAFLTFKRSRLGAILREYETNVKILVQGKPVRSDLTWREKLMETVNFDLIDDNKNSVHLVETLDWKATHTFLSHIYNRDHNKYRFNILIAPLGSKMQTVGSWVFAVENPSVKLITSSPERLFPEKYSRGWRDTFIIKDLPFRS